MAWEPEPGDYVRPVGLQKAAVLNGVLGQVQPQSFWKEGRVAVLLNTTPPKGMQFKLKNLEHETTEPPLCTVCLEGVPSPIQMGCGCRGAQGLAHVKCRAEVAKRSAKRRDRTMCGTCGQRFTGAMQLGLAEALWARLQGRPADAAQRGRAEVPRCQLQAAPFRSAYQKQQPL